jgi:hypothetical protein
MLVASLGGLYLPHVRQRQITLALSNSAGFGLSALGAAATVAALGYRSSSGWSTTAALALVAVCVDWIINSSIVGVASGIRGGMPLLVAVRDQLMSDVDVLALAFAVGALTAASTEHLLPVAVLSICLMLAAFEIRLACRRVIDVTDDRRSEQLVTALLITVAVLALLADPGLGTLATGCLALFLVQAKDRLMTLPAIAATVVCSLVGAVAFAVGLPFIMVAAQVFATSFAVIEAAVVTRRAKRAGLRVSPWTAMGLLAPGRREILGVTLVVAVVGLATLRRPDALDSPLVLGYTLVAIAVIFRTQNTWRRFLLRSP